MLVLYAVQSTAPRFQARRIWVKSAHSVCATVLSRPSVGRLAREHIGAADREVVTAQALALIAAADDLAS